MINRQCIRQSEAFSQSKMFTPLKQYYNRSKFHLPGMIYFVFNFPILELWFSTFNQISKGYFFYNMKYQILLKNLKVLETADYHAHIPSMITAALSWWSTHSPSLPTYQNFRDLNRIQAFYFLKENWWEIDWRRISIPCNCIASQNSNHQLATTGTCKDI